MYLKNSNLKVLNPCQIITSLLVLLDPIKNQLGALLDHDCVVTFESDVRRMLIHEVGES
jgi:hypothetical protein